MQPDNAAGGVPTPIQQHYQPQSPSPIPPSPFPPAQPQQQFPPSAPPPKDKKRFIIIAAVAAAVVIAGVATTLILVNQNKGSSGDSSNSTSSSNTNNGGSSGNADNSSRKELQEKTINQIITDDALGYTIAVKKVMFNLPFDGDDGLQDGLRREDSYNSIAAELEITNSSQYSNSFYTSNIALSINGQTFYSGETLMSEFIDERNLVILPTSVAQNRSSSGWMFFMPNVNAKGDIMLVYSRSAMRGTDGTEIPAKTFEVKVN